METNRSLASSEDFQIIVAYRIIVIFYVAARLYPVFLRIRKYRALLTGTGTA